MVWRPVKDKENSEFKPVKLSLKVILLSHPARVEVNTYIRAVFFFVLLKYLLDSTEFDCFLYHKSSRSDFFFPKPNIVFAEQFYFCEVTVCRHLDDSQENALGWYIAKINFDRILVWFPDNVGPARSVSRDLDLEFVFPSWHCKSSGYH